MANIDARLWSRLRNCQTHWSGSVPPSLDFRPSRSSLILRAHGDFEERSSDLEGERVRLLRLRADGQRPLAVNLEETILLVRKLFELRDAARRAS